MKNIFKSIVIGLALMSTSALAAEGDGVFIHTNQKFDDGKTYSVYKTNIGGGQLFFLTSTNESDGKTAVRYAINGKLYRVTHLNVCVDETDHCWANMLFGKYLEELVDQFKYESTEYNKLSWRVNYIKNGELASTEELVKKPALGVLEKFLEQDYDGMDGSDYVGHDIVWTFGPKVAD